MYIQRCARGAVNTNEIWSQGAQFVLEQGLNDVGMNVDQNTSYGGPLTREWFINFGGLAGVNRQPITITINIWSRKYIRYIVRREIKK